MHTIQSIKKTLPDVKVKIGKQVFHAMVVGRNNPFATVTFKMPLIGFVSYEYAWPTILHSLESGKPLTV